MLDFYPAEHRAEIDALNQTIYETFNNGVYRAGFATAQGPYERAARRVFETLDTIEERLATSRYLFGSRPLETDWRLFVTLVRFDPVYYVHFKCNLRRIAQYPNLFGYLRDLYQIDGVAETVEFRSHQTPLLHHARRHQSDSASCRSARRKTSTLLTGVSDWARRSTEPCAWPDASVSETAPYQRICPTKHCSDPSQSSR